MIHHLYKEFIRPLSGAFGIWLTSMVLLIVARVEGEFILGWGVLTFIGILLYWHSMRRLIPKALGRKHRFLTYFKAVLVLLLVTYIPITFCLFLYTRDLDAAFLFSSLNVLFQLLFTTGISWIIYQEKAKALEEVIVLKQELGQSNAHFDFLRSQINPHFLFNALNTIYSTALQEHANATGEAVQKLGDMMRFMLRENMQERIQLSREIEYLENYIALQRLRIKRSPNITIEVSLEQNEQLKIAPMLLIPFVENAFKHGISMQNPSYISVQLSVVGERLRFHVLNTRHPAAKYDTEKDHGGIGLENVQGRLRLLYPDRYELLITDADDKFEVKLDLSL